MGGAAGGGGGGGGGGDGEVRGIEFVRYYEQMMSRIRENWVYVGEDQNLAVTVRFSIQGDGRVVNVRRSDSSGNPLFDQSVESAVRGVRDLGPPPAQYARDFSDVEVTFRAKDLAQ
jgi:TonB family protein